MPGSADLDGDGKVSYEELRALGKGRPKAPDAGAKERNSGSHKPGGAVDTDTSTPRPDGPKPTEQQIIHGAYAGRHVGGWKYKDELLAPDNKLRYDRDKKAVDGNGDRLMSMSNVHGTWFGEEELKKRWFDKHNGARDSIPAETFFERLYPLDRQTDVNEALGDTPGLSYSPWEPTEEDMTPMSKAVGSYASKGGPKKAAMYPQPKPPSGTMKAAPKPKPPPPPHVSLSDNPSWGKVREGDESDLKPDPAWGYTGNYYARRFDKGEEDLSMATRINRRRQQAIERRFSASPYAHEIAMDVMKLSDGVEYTGPTVYGWRSFPPQGLVDIDGDGKVDSPFTESGAFALQKIDPRMAQSMLH
jgi:hypothetical protein